MALYSKPIASKMKSADWQVTFTLSEQVFQLSSTILTQSRSRPRYMVDALFVTRLFILKKTTCNQGLLLETIDRSIA